MAQLCAYVGRSLADADYPKTALIGTPDDLATTSGFGDDPVCLFGQPNRLSRRSFTASLIGRECPGLCTVGDMYEPTYWLA